MKRKMMAKEAIPAKKTTNGGNGSYMRRSVMQDKKRGGKPLSSNLKQNATATGKAVLKAM